MKRSISLVISTTWPEHSRRCSPMSGRLRELISSRIPSGNIAIQRPRNSSSAGDDAR
ncbi:MAG TPA: hypothetical protein VF643_08480 [Sphingomonas sp.]